MIIKMTDKFSLVQIIIFGNVTINNIHPVVIFKRIMAPMQMCEPLTTKVQNLRPAPATN